MDHNLPPELHAEVQCRQWLNVKYQFYSIVSHMEMLERELGAHQMLS
jgi:hypothetical protein